jgi:hypothetical protein
MATYNVGPLFSRDATTTDPARDGSNLGTGAQIYRDGKPITVTYDNGVLYDWVQGHVNVSWSNDRSPLTLTEGEQS